MFRDGLLPIAVLSAIFSALFTWLVNSLCENATILIFASFMVYFGVFVALFGAAYDIAHKVKVKSNKYLLSCCISAIIAWTALLLGFTYSNIYLGLVYCIAFGGLIFFGALAADYEKNGK